MADEFRQCDSEESQPQRDVRSPDSEISEAEQHSRSARDSQANAELAVSASRVTTINWDDVPIPPDENDHPTVPLELDFFRYAHSELGNKCLLLSFLPVPEEVVCELRGRIIAPPAGGESLDMVCGNGFSSVAHLLEVSRLVVGVCTVGDECQHQAACRIIKQLRAFKPVILIVLLSPIPTPREIMDEFEKQSSELMDTGIADVILHLDMAAGTLKHSVDLALKTREIDTHRMEDMLAEEPLLKNDEELDELRDKHSHLLFSSIPRYCMQAFPGVDSNIAESGMRVGEYQFERKFQCEQGKVVLARAADGRHVVIKITSKCEVSNAQQVEDINREHRFLREVIKHPNIAKCIDFVHTAARLYMVMEFHGIQNLAQYCKTQTGQHLEIEEAICCFEQVVGALGYMHGINIAHRCLAPNHVVLKQQDEGGFIATLVDFRCAVLAKADHYSNVVCALLPCIAPEMAWGDAYIPRLVDSWSCGIVLLEMAGGLTSLSASVGIGVEENDAVDNVQAIVNFFNKAGSHEEALSKLNGVHSPEIVGYLQNLLVYPPENRMEMREIAKNFEQQGDAETAS